MPGYIREEGIDTLSVSAVGKVVSSCGFRLV